MAGKGPRKGEGEDDGRATSREPARGQSGCMAKCWGPPPLPPSSGSARRRRLSSTYRSFKEDLEAAPPPPRPAPLARSRSDGNLARGSTLGRCLRALGGSWKNLLLLGGMSRPAPQVKKVPPPAVPDVFRHSGSSFGSAGYSSSEDTCFLAPVEATTRDGCDHSEVYAMAGKSPGGQFSYPAFTFPGPQGIQYTQLMHSGKGSSYYHHQLSLQEDQGIDMTQSPGRDSPGSSGSGSGSGSGSRHSTASLDSGRASGYHLLGPVGATQRGGSGSTVSSSSPRCSLSSSSLGSGEQGAPAARAERLLQQGVPDQDVLHAWLMDLHFEEYFPLFASAGYDMPTMCRMTPEDLTAIGIKKPNHRKKLKAEIGLLNISDGLPEYIPGSMEEWLRLLRLEEYVPALVQQGYHTVQDVTQLTWEDLEDIGIVKLGHQKKILLAIKRVKDIQTGKRFPLLQQHVDIISQESGVGGEGSVSPDDGYPRNVHTTLHAFHQPWELETSFAQLHHYHHHQQHHHFSNTAPPQPPFFHPMFCPDIVPIKIRGGRGKSLESLEDGTERTHHTFSAENTQTFYYQQRPGWRPRSYDDGDITPTNEAVPLHEGGGTLPRPRGLVRPRPVAKIPAKTRSEAPPLAEKPPVAVAFYRSLPRDLVDVSKYGLGKRAPSPPKRRSSRGEADVVIDCSGPVPTAANATTVTADLHASAPSPPCPLPLPAYPSGDRLDAGADLPLPPPPVMSRSWGSVPGGSDLPSVEQELISSLSLQQSRNGSDASFKSSSSTESDSLPFANENAGTIKQRVTRPHPTLTAVDYPETEFVPPQKRPQNPQGELAASQKTLRDRSSSQEPADVLNDIGNMLANLTDELDAMLEEEKRQGLNQ